jgi:glycosyl hydrolase family 79
VSAKTIFSAPIPPRPTRRSLLIGLGALAGASILPGCGTSSSSQPSGPSNPTQPVPSGPLTSASISISSTAAGTIVPAFCGLSYEKSAMAKPLFMANNSDLIGLFHRLGKSSLRIGGNSVDKTTWTPAGAGLTSGQVAPFDVDNLAAFLKATGWSVLYGVNLGQSTPALAAAEITYAQQSLGSSLTGIEIGNEPDLYGGNYFPSPWTYAEYLALWQSFANTILQAVPNAPLTGPTIASPGNIETWTKPFSQTEAKVINLLTQHYYRGNGQSASSTIADLLSPDAALITMLSNLDAISSSSVLPFRIAETNSFYNGGASGVSDSYASALWILDHLFNIALGGGIGANFHGGGDGTGYTPIADNNGQVVEARPEFYGMLLFTLAGQGTLQQTAVDANGLNVSAYTVKPATGGLNLIVVNKDATNNLSLTIECPQAVSSATLSLMTGPSLPATTGVTIQGAPINPDGSFSPGLPYTVPASGTQVTAYLNPASAALIQII